MSKCLVASARWRRGPGLQRGNQDVRTHHPGNVVGAKHLIQAEVVAVAGGPGRAGVGAPWGSGGGVWQRTGCQYTYMATPRRVLLRTVWPCQHVPLIYAASTCVHAEQPPSPP